MYCSLLDLLTLLEIRDYPTSTWYVFEPSHEIMVIFVLRKLILQIHMRSCPVVLDVWYLVGLFVTSILYVCEQRKALAKLRGRAGSPEPSRVAYVISIIISWAGSFWVREQRLSFWVHLIDVFLSVVNINNDFHCLFDMFFLNLISLSWWLICYTHKHLHNDTVIINNVHLLSICKLYLDIYIMVNSRWYEMVTTHYLIHYFLSVTCFIDLW